MHEGTSVGGYKCKICTNVQLIKYCTSCQPEVMYLVMRSVLAN